MCILIFEQVKRLFQWITTAWKNTPSKYKTESDQQRQNGKQKQSGEQRQNGKQKQSEEELNKDKERGDQSDYTSDRFAQEILELVSRMPRQVPAKPLWNLLQNEKLSIARRTDLILLLENSRSRNPIFNRFIENRILIVAQVFVFLHSLQTDFLFFDIYSSNFDKKSLNFVVDQIMDILVDFLKDICKYQNEIVDLKIDNDQDCFRLNEILKKNVLRVKTLGEDIRIRKLVPDDLLLQTNQILDKFIREVYHGYFKIVI